MLLQDILPEVWTKHQLVYHNVSRVQAQKCLHPTFGPWTERIAGVKVQ